ncbi:SDR family oxidoreductase [Aneurinibacillus sp. Ricciae_BoGa-3]|uniref:elongation factor P 5-aminopentanone reductase n=1 Tax=Aneurinibacillus sp. Ricciae_BoGa-3 TaxID=3022697 RepID=UPI0023424BA1|nr:SDR family NAD(P)-dependent oxidoreductase [Aneurinibacillus sp. Ricciae_BoGa-3]WCK56137.1 SDR family oxidoreductase [Aneurinibacillus sp. Ricciae_BoGa-3]
MGRKEKWACITGAGRGIGAAIALRLAREGYDLLLHYHSSQNLAETVAAECRKEGSEVHLVCADLTSTDGAHELFGKLPFHPDVLILNAGISQYGVIQDVTPDEFDKMINIHVRAPFFCAQQALPHMIRRGYGRIITLSSIWGLAGASCEVLYSAAKGAVNSFTKALAKEAAPSGITVNAVAPGMIDTEMIRDQYSAEDIDGIIEEIPAGRMGQSAEIAALIAFIASEEAGYINGQVISANGAWYC